MNFASIVENLTGVIVSDRSLNILWTNDQLNLLLEVPGKDFTGESLLDFFKVDDKEEFVRMLQDARDAEQTVTHDVRYERKSGMSITLRFEINPVTATDDGSPVYHISVGRSMSQSQTIRDSDSKTLQRNRASFERKYKLTSLTFEHARDIFLELDDQVVKDELYRNPDFSLNDATRLIGTNELYLSQAVNFFSGHSFTAYINAKRIGYILKHARDIVGDEPVWKTAGFGSYHAFYRHVKKHHKVTPQALLESVVSSEGVTIQ